MLPLIRCSLMHVPCCPSQKTHFPAKGKKKKEEWRCSRVKKQVANDEPLLVISWDVNVALQHSWRFDVDYLVSMCFYLLEFVLFLLCRRAISDRSHQFKERKIKLYNTLCTRKPIRLSLSFVWWFSLFRTFAAFFCSARFSPDSLWSSSATLASWNFISCCCILATAIYLSRAPKQKKQISSVVILLFKVVSDVASLQWCVMRTAMVGGWRFKKKHLASSSLFWRLFRTLRFLVRPIITPCDVRHLLGKLWNMIKHQSFFDVCLFGLALFLSMCYARIKPRTKFSTFNQTCLGLCLPWNVCLFGLHFSNIFLKKMKIGSCADCIHKRFLSWEKIKL